MCSDLFKSLVNDLEMAVYDCGYASGKQKGSVSLEKLTRPVITRATLLHAIAALEDQSRTRRERMIAELIENDLAASSTQEKP